MGYPRVNRDARYFSGRIDFRIWPVPRRANGSMPLDSFRKIPCGLSAEASLRRTMDTEISPPFLIQLADSGANHSPFGRRFSAPFPEGEPGSRIHPFLQLLVWSPWTIKVTWQESLIRDNIKKKTGCQEKRLKEKIKHFTPGKASRNSLNRSGGMGAPP